MGTNWTLQGCCNEEQWIVIGLVGGYMLLIILLWHTPILTPLKLLTVFLHELGHASAAWMTCGKVEGIVVEENQGGHTLTRGGKMCCILPAGYLGSSFWGCFFVIMGFAGNDTSQVAAIVLGLALTGVGLFYAQNCLLRVLCLFFLALIVLLFVLELTYDVNFLQYLLTLFGVMNGMYSTFDIYDDLIRRKVHGSDAVQFEKLTGVPARCWGAFWFLISLIFLGFAVYASLLIND